MSAELHSTVRVAADELADVHLTVNGTPVTLQLPTRVTLADALRDHLGLTGTHLGCEHGVCGMCTVVVDGAAARACLLFACQVGGADVLTVEGLGTPDNLHPIQESLGRHHGLQCGFCTPGFLMSSYDLLSHHPGVTDAELPEQLSGVLCRCTGYRNILAAVSDVAAAHPEGIPAPLNCGKRVLIGRAARTSSSGEPSEPALEAATLRVPDAVTLPSGDPSFTVDIQSELSASLVSVKAVIGDIDLLARCLPGAELTDHLGDDRYRGRVRVGLGPIKLSFTGLAEVVHRSEDGCRIRVIGQGEDLGGGRAQIAIDLQAERVGEASRLAAQAEVYLTGRIAQFGRSLAGDVSQRMFEQFCVAVDQAATSGVAPTTSPRVPSALALLRVALWRRLRSVFVRG